MLGINHNQDNVNLPLVSIVTPSFNQGRFIGQTIESVLNQTYPNLEYWVIDGASTDDTLSILRQFEGDHRFNWLSELDQGQAHAINKGWSLSQGEIIGWLNSDDIYKPTALASVVAAFSVLPEVVIICGGALIIDEAGKKLGEIPAPHLDLNGILKLAEFLPQPAVFMKASAVKQVGGLNINLNYAMDLDLFLRLAAIGKITYIDHFLAEYRLYPGTKTSNYLHCLRKETATVAQTFIKAIEPQSPIKINKRQRLSYAYLVEAYADFRLGNNLDMLKHVSSGLFVYPFNVVVLLQQALKHTVGLF